jgi:hypothetical protein
VILAPVLALLQISGRELPVLLGPLEAFSEAPFLFLPRHVEEELANQGPIPGQVALDIANVFAAVLPQTLRLQ